METSAIANGRDQLASQLRQVIEQADDLLRHAADAGDRRLDEARLRLEHQFAELRLQIDELEEGVRYRARRAARAADAALHEHPYRGIAAGAALGLLVGLLVGRR
ncbi:MAG TPA: hypothetical protein VF291_04050 [Burkholderiaceae bacterium]